ncbi:MmcQ/YjbR family DNA-binding protein [Prevotella sp. KH2C16]|uniref:MmcQ/YjbR family DNA-binding protein n=1 Tax=Prevotella sp. KH2C16 TaxID=1855325 RepID=UPI0008E2A26E|nr:MmcQ/YjbR family DNA-binding protein [Prevotella sp. KH2C16]SFG16682.1 Predicted DNA-binding protein, MmcQ/YjbR family [Prevotella sp. KH2C16]
MNIEELRSFCLSLSEDVVEKFPFQQFKAARDVLAFYTGGHIFCYFDINDLHHVTVKCRKEEVPALLEQYDCLGHPYNGNPKYWIGIDATRAEATLIQRLITNSFRLTEKKK